MGTGSEPEKSQIENVATRCTVRYHTLRMNLLSQYQTSMIFISSKLQQSDIHGQHFSISISRTYITRGPSSGAEDYCIRAARAINLSIWLELHDPLQIVYLSNAKSKYHSAIHFTWASRCSTGRVQLSMAAMAEHWGFFCSDPVM